MRSFVAALALIAMSVLPQSVFAVSWDRINHLFYVERSKNKNVVQYDVRLTEENELPDSSPVTVYWVLENGRHQQLNSIEKRFAYGIGPQEKIGTNRFRVFPVALKDREVVIEKINGSFKASVPINGKLSILEKIYIESKEKLGGLPKVLYVALFGRTRQGGLRVEERIAPK